MSARRLEMSVEQLKNKTTSQLAELGKKSDAINRMKVELGERANWSRRVDDHLVHPGGGGIGQQLRHAARRAERILHPARGHLLGV